MKEHKRNATGHSQWNCSFSCGTAGNNYKWVIQPTSAGSALLPDFKALPCAALGHSSLRPRCFACAAVSRGELPWLRGKKVGGGQGKRLWVQAGGVGRSRGGFCLFAWAQWLQPGACSAEHVPSELPCCTRAFVKKRREQDWGWGAGKASGPAISCVCWGWERCWGFTVGCACSAPRPAAAPGVALPQGSAGWFTALLLFAGAAEV